MIHATAGTSRFVRPTLAGDAGPDRHIPDYPTRPIDEQTGLPYCFVSDPSLLPVAPSRRNQEGLADWDHQFPIVETKYGGNPVLLRYAANLALMNLRVQWTDYKQHHFIWNNAEYVGPKQPGTARQLAATLLFGLSGYIPEYGISLQGYRPKIQKLSDEERRFMWESGQVKVACETPIIKYLRNYVLTQEMDHIQESKLDEFMNTLDLDRRIYLGHCLAAKVIERAVEPFDKAYSQAHKQGLLALSIEEGSLPAPNNPRDFLKYKLTHGGRRFGPVMDALTKRLAEHRRELQTVA